MKHFIMFTLVFAAASASYSGHEHQGDYYVPPNYNFQYNVYDPHTDDVKIQHESRHGDVVKGFYSVKEADGSTREVHYTADDHNGFKADVKKIGYGTHPRTIYQHGGQEHQSSSLHY